MANDFIQTYKLPDDCQHGEPVAIRIVDAINELRSEEQDSVTIYFDNPDFIGQNCAIKCQGDWVNDRDELFFGESLVDVLEKAASRKRITLVEVKDGTRR